MQHLTPAYLAEVEGRLDAAFDGPFRAVEMDVDNARAPISGSAFEIQLPNGDTVGTIHDKDEALMFSNAPTDLRNLLAEVRRLRGAIEAHKKGVRSPLPGDYDRTLWAALGKDGE